MLAQIRIKLLENTLKKRMKVLEMMEGELMDLHEAREARDKGEDLQYERWIGVIEILPSYPDSVELIMETERQKERYSSLIKSLFSRLGIEYAGFSDKHGEDP